MIYNGQEIGEVRQPSLSHKELIQWKRKSSGPNTVSQIRKFYKKLARLRQEHPSLSRGQRFHIDTSDPKNIFSFARSYREDAVLVAVNFSAQEVRTQLHLPEIFSSESGKLELKAVFPEEHRLRLKEGSLTELVLAPWGYQIWTHR